MMDFYIDIFLSFLFVGHLAWYGYDIKQNQVIAKRFLYSSAAKQVLKMAMPSILISVFFALLVDVALLWRLFAVLGNNWTSSTTVLMCILFLSCFLLCLKSNVYDKVVIAAQDMGAAET
jgi:hypothetical protein